MIKRSRKDILDNESNLVIKSLIDFGGLKICLETLS